MTSLRGLKGALKAHDKAFKDITQKVKDEYIAEIKKMKNCHKRMKNCEAKSNKDNS